MEPEAGTVEEEIAQLRGRVKRLWIALALLFTMVVALVVVLASFSLILYSDLQWGTSLPYMGGVALQVAALAVLFFFAVIIWAVAKS